MTDVTIEIRNKTHHGAQTPTIENFSLSLGAGEFVCLVGQSGYGKTTLLNSIAGLDANYVGNIRLSNTTQSPKIGYVFQQPCLLPSLDLDVSSKYHLDASKDRVEFDGEWKHGASSNRQAHDRA